MSTYLERPALLGQRPERLPLPEGLPDRPRVESDRRSPARAAWGELWKRTLGGSFERLPDPARHPECWFKLI